MSRLGRKPVEIPAGVKVTIDGSRLTVSKGEASLSIDVRPEVNVGWTEDEKAIVVSIPDELRKVGTAKAYWGTTRSLIDNMVTGVTKGYQKRLDVVGVGYTAVVNGAMLDLKVGFANTISVPIPSGLDVKVERQIVTIKGIDKQMVGQFAAVVRAKRKPEPYNGKGIKYFDEVIRRKQGKAFGA